VTPAVYVTMDEMMHIQRSGRQSSSQQSSLLCAPSIAPPHRRQPASNGLTSKAIRYYSCCRSLRLPCMAAIAPSCRVDSSDCLGLGRVCVWLLKSD